MHRTPMIQRLIRRLGFVLAASLAIMLVSILTLTFFYWLVEGDQGKGRGIFDWLYFTVITTRTIGFGDITPETYWGKIGTIFNALLPASLFFGASLVVLEGFFRWLEDGYRRYRMKNFSDHHIVVADSELMESIVQEYTLDRRPFVCVGTDRIEDLPPRLQETLDETNYYCGDPTRDEILEAVNVRKASVIVIATHDDNVNLYVLVTARGLAPEIKTIVRVNRLETESKFRSVGADELLPAGTMLGRMVCQAAVSPVALDLMIRLQTGTRAPFLHEVRIGPEKAGTAVREAFDSVVAVFRDGEYVFDLDEFILQNKDVVLRIGERRETV